MLIPDFDLPLKISKSSLDTSLTHKQLAMNLSLSLSSHLSEMKRGELGWSYETYSLLTTLRLTRQILKINPQSLISESRFANILVFLRNNQVLASNVAEGLETLYLDGVISQGLKLVYMWMGKVQKLEDCGKICVFKFWVKMSERVKNESGGDWKGCTIEARSESGKDVKIEKVVSYLHVLYNIKI